VASRSVVLPRARGLLARRNVQRQIAPLRIRLLALPISAVMAIAMFAALIAAGTGALAIWRRVRSERAELSGDSQRTVLSGFDASGESESSIAEKLQSRRFRLFAALVSFVVGVREEGRQGPVARALGLRLVDLRTGGRITRGQAVVRVGVRTAWSTLAKRLAPGPKPTPQKDQQQLAAEMQEARRRYADDERAREEAFARMYAKHKPSQPNRWGCLVPLVAPLALELPALWSPLNQGLADRLAGTVIVLEPPRGLLGRLVSRLL
jgi:hypothetical protein